MKRFYVIIAIASFLLACTKEVVEPGMRISGIYALDDQSGLSYFYIVFDENEYSDVRLTKELTFVDNSLWGYNKNLEYKSSGSAYSIIGGRLYVSERDKGTIEIKDDSLKIQGKKFSKVKSFNEELYSSITLPEGMEKTTTYDTHEVSVPVTINRPIPAGVLSATSRTTWISGVKVQDGRVFFEVGETNIDRTGYITIKYTNAENISLAVLQRPSTFIRMAETEKIVGYAHTSHSIPYSIENPIPGSSLNLESSASWVKNISVGDDAITFDVDENPNSSSRTATLTCSYSGAANVILTLTQSGAVTAIIPTPTSQSSTYAGGDFSFDFTIENPRQGINVVATSMSYWITAVSVSGNTINYKVAENNGSASRTGSIKLTYGTFASKNFSVLQNYVTTQMSIIPDSQSCTYTGGCFSFDYTIDNPRQGINVVATSMSSWITDVSVSGNTINYKVAENNYGAARTGKVSVSYGSYATKNFTVNQSWSSSEITLTPGSQDTDYDGGSFTFTYDVTNPRESVTIAATSQSDWITGITISGNTIGYKVAENNSAFARNSIISLSYGAHCKTEYQVNQSGMPIQSLSLNKSDLALFLGRNETLLASAFPVDTPLQWSSDNTSVATVNQTGQVTAVANGTATITVSAENRKTASCVVTVTTAVTRISLNKTSLYLQVNESEMLVSTIYPTTASDKSITWSSSNEDVATVSREGLVTAKSIGTASIKATANDGSGVVSSCSVNVEEPLDLSALGSANCYIVSSYGIYSFPTTKGNSSTLVGEVSSAAVLWESYGTSEDPSVGSIIDRVLYSNNTITFYMPTSFKDGNAVIAAKDARGKILWSWHIWVCWGSWVRYLSEKGRMDRNLGATSDTPGNVGALGLLYQWGRKDPFLGSSSISSETRAASTGSWYAVESTSSTGTIDYAVAHPTTFITYNSSNDDWYYQDFYYGTDNTRWQSSKTIYDPCPPGWKVPSKGSLPGGYSTYFSDKEKGTYYYDNKQSPSWYPAAGSKYFNHAGIRGVGREGYWWSCTPNDKQAYCLISTNSGVFKVTDTYRADGLSVRCVKE